MKSILQDFFLVIAVFVIWFTFAFGPMVAAIVFFAKDGFIGFLSMVWMLASGFATAYVLHNFQKGEYQ